MRFALLFGLALTACGTPPTVQPPSPPAVTAWIESPVCSDATGATVTVSGELGSRRALAGELTLALDGGDPETVLATGPGPFTVTTTVPNGTHSLVVCYTQPGADPGCAPAITTAVTCACTGVSCDDGNPCTHDLCDPATGCRHLDVARCATPGCALGACAGPDADGDGLSDAWESQGYVDVNCNGMDDGPAVDLPLPNADPQKPNVYVEYDYLEKPGAGTACVTDGQCSVAGEQCIAGVCTHSHRPAQAALDAVVASFAAHGVILTIDASPEAIAEKRVVSYGTTPGTRTLDAACVGNDAVNFYDLKDAHFDPRRIDVYHYVVFAHLSTCDNANGASCGACPDNPPFGSSGLAELPGNDAIVSLGYALFDLSPPKPRTREIEGGTFMHELGHNLGLHHGGGADGPLFKPNYVSVMNGAFQFTGIRVADTPGSTVADPALTRLDYSSAVLPTLDESALVESAGIGAGTNDITAFTNGMFNDVNGAGSGAIDWSGNGMIDSSPVSADVNSDGVISMLEGWNDWTHLTAAFQCLAGSMSN